MPARTMDAVNHLAPPSDGRMPETHDLHNIPPAIVGAEASWRRFFLFAMVAAEQRDQLDHCTAAALKIEGHAHHQGSRTGGIRIRKADPHVQLLDAHFEAQTRGSIAVAASWAVMLSFFIAHWGLLMVQKHGVVEVGVSLADVSALALIMAEDLANTFNSTFIVCPMVITRREQDGQSTPLVIFRPVLVALHGIFGVGNEKDIAAGDLRPFIAHALSLVRCGDWNYVQVGGYMIPSPLIYDDKAGQWFVNFQMLQQPLIGSYSSSLPLRLDMFRGWEVQRATFNLALVAQCLLCFVGWDSEQASGSKYIVYVGDGRKMESMFGRFSELIAVKGHRKCPSLVPSSSSSNSIRLLPLSNVASAALGGKPATAQNLRHIFQPSLLRFRRQLPIQYGNYTVNSPITPETDACGNETGRWFLRMSCLQEPVVIAS